MIGIGSISAPFSKVREKARPLPEIEAHVVEEITRGVSPRRRTASAS